MKKLIFTLPVCFILMLFACRKDSLNTTTTNTGPEPQVLVETGVFGQVTDLSNQPVEGATVYFDNKQTQTDAHGYFRLTGRGDSKQAAVRVEKAGYFPSFAGFIPEKGVEARLAIVLREKDLAGSLTAAGGGTVTFGNGNEVKFAAGAFTDASGQPYSGAVQVYADYIDPSLASTRQVIPGSFAGLSATGERQVLESYGMMHVVLESPAGLPLQISQPATLTMSVPADRIALAPSTIPLWYLDETTGLWREEGEAVLQNGKYVGQVSHFTLWNCDMGFPVVTVSGNVFVENFFPFVEVRFTRPGGVDVRSTNTSTSGNFSGMVPANETLVMEILNACGEVLYTANIGPFTVNTDLGSIGLPWTNAWVAVSGTLTDCNSQPVTNGYVRGDIDGNSFPISLNPVTGQFNGMTSNCGGAGSNISVYGIDLTAMMESDVVTVPVSNQVNVGTLQACAGQVDNGVNFVFGGMIKTYTPCTATWALDPTLSLHEIKFTADLSGGSVLYTLSLIDWNNGVGDPIWGLSVNYQVFGAPASYYGFSGGDIEMIQYATTSGSTLILSINNVSFTEQPSGNVTPGGKIEIKALIQ